MTLAWPWRHGRYKVLARLDGGRFPKLQNLTPKTHAQAQAAELTDFEIYDIRTDTSEAANLLDVGLTDQDVLLKAIKSGYAELLKDSPAWTPVTD